MLEQRKRIRADGRTRKRLCSQLRLALSFSVFVLLGSVSLGGQTAGDSESTISTDRPSVANSSVVVPRGDFQAENGLLVTNTQGQYVLDLPETALRFGLLDKTELRLAVPDYFETLSMSGLAVSGFGDIAIGVTRSGGSSPHSKRRLNAGLEGLLHPPCRVPSLAYPSFSSSCSSSTTGGRHKR